MPRPGERPGATEFACTFWPPFRGVAVLLLVLTPILSLTIDNPQRHWSVAPLAYLAVTMLSALPIGFMVWAYRVDTDSAGIGGQTIWNVYRRLAWYEIASAKRIPILPGVSYARLAPSKGGPVIWVPLFLLEREKFEKVVADTLPPGHPFVSVLSERPRSYPS